MIGGGGVKGGWGVSEEGTAGETGGESRCERGGQPVKTWQLPEWIRETPDAQVSGSGGARAWMWIERSQQRRHCTPNAGARVRSPAREPDPTYRN